MATYRKEWASHGTQIHIVGPNGVLAVYDPDEEADADKVVEKLEARRRAQEASDANDRG